MAAIAPPAGCSFAQYPQLTWRAKPCQPPPRKLFSHPPKTAHAVSKQVGNGVDYVLRTPESVLLKEADGSFPAMSGVKTVTTTGAGDFDGPGQYSLQLNTNFDQTTSACEGRKDCLVWQQFVYSTRYPEADSSPKIWIVYWLLNYLHSQDDSCPYMWYEWFDDCYINTPLVDAPLLPVTELGGGNMRFLASTANGTDRLTLMYGNQGVAYSGKSIVDIAQVWTNAEFNIFGNTPGLANFNEGSSLTVQIDAGYQNLQQSTRPPICIKNAGTTFETNNLNLGSCTAAGYPLVPMPRIQFTQSN
jgi:hypothetical protein